MIAELLHSSKSLPKPGNVGRALNCFIYDFHEIRIEERLAEIPDCTRPLCAECKGYDLPIGSPGGRIEYAVPEGDYPNMILLPACQYAEKGRTLKNSARPRG